MPRVDVSNYVEKVNYRSQTDLIISTILYGGILINLTVLLRILTSTCVLPYYKSGLQPGIRLGQIGIGLRDWGNVWTRSYLSRGEWLVIKKVYVPETSMVTQGGCPLTVTRSRLTDLNCLTLYCMTSVFLRAKRPVFRVEVYSRCHQKWSLVTRPLTPLNWHWFSGINSLSRKVR